MTAPGAAGPVRTAALELLGAAVDLEAEDGDLLEGLLGVYASVPRDPVPPARRLAARILGAGAQSGGLEVRGKAIHGEGADRRSAGAALAFPLFHELVEEVEDSFVLHAGAVVIGGQAVVLVAPSQAGKTTLSVALALAGAGFLSDEAAPIRRADGRVLPFPRAVGLRPGPLLDRPELAKLAASAPRVRERGGRDRLVVDLVAGGLVRAAAAAPLGHVVFLAEGSDDPAGDQPVRWRVEIDRRSPALAELLRAVPGVQSVREDGGSLEPALRIAVERGAGLARALDAAGSALGVSVVRMVADLGEPDRTGEPRLRPVSPAQGVLRLVRHVENGARSRLFRRALGGRAAGFAHELAGLVSGAGFWELGPGRLDASCRSLLALA